MSIICDINLAGVSLWPGSESRSPMILQVISTSATRQKMKQLVPYMIIAGTLNTETNIKICVEWMKNYSTYCPSPSLPDMLSLYCQRVRDTNLINLSPAARLTAPTPSEVLADEMYKSDQNQSGSEFNLKIKFEVLCLRLSGNLIKDKYLRWRQEFIQLLRFKFQVRFFISTFFLAGAGQLALK